MEVKMRLLLPVFLFAAAVLTGQNLDIRWLDKINGPVHPPADRPWQFVSNSMAPVGVAAPLTMFIVGAAEHDSDLKRKSYEAGAAFLLNAALTTGLKVAVHRPRPFVTYPDRIVKKSAAGSFSFPSGHTSTAFATATSLSLAFPKWYVIAPSFAYAGAVAYSRMYLGVHYPSDLLGGILIGVGSSLLTFQVSRWIRK